VVNEYEGKPDGEHRIENIGTSPIGYAMTTGAMLLLQLWRLTLVRPEPELVKFASSSKEVLLHNSNSICDSRMIAASNMCHTELIES
jgi:hypothetical protein